MRVVTAPTPSTAMVMRIVTRFTTVDEFVSAFRTFCTKSTCFVPSVQATRIGVETGFSIRLADGAPMLRGVCVVRDSWATAENPFERPGVRLGIRSLTAESKPVFRRLLLAGGKPDLDEHARPTLKVELLFAQEERATDDLILPANPLMEMSDESLAAFVDCTLFEDAIPDLIDTGDSSINDATGRIDDDRTDHTTRRIEVTQRIETEAAPKGTPLERALAASSMRLQSGTTRLERLNASRVRAHALAEEHADSAFGPMLAMAVERIRPVADHTAPTRMPSECKTIVGVPPVPPPTLRPRIAMRAITAPLPAAPDEPPAASGIRGWYRKLVRPRRTRG